MCWLCSFVDYLGSLYVWWFYSDYTALGYAALIPHDALNATNSSAVLYSPVRCTPQKRCAGSVNHRDRMEDEKRYLLTHIKVFLSMQTLAIDTRFLRR